VYDKEEYMTFNPKTGFRNDPFKWMIKKSKLSANEGVYGGNNPTKMVRMKDENGKPYSYHNPKLDPKTGLKAGTKKHTITADDLEKLWKKQKGMCFWMDIPMEFKGLFVSNSPWAPSVERLDNSKGYVKGNVVLATAFANKGRGAYKGSILSFKRKLRKLMRQV
jgi:hypothetical protein